MAIDYVNKVGIPDAEKNVLKSILSNILEGCANVSLLGLPLPVVGRYLDL